MMMISLSVYLLKLVTLYTLNMYLIACQYYHNKTVLKTGKKKEEMLFAHVIGKSRKALPSDMTRSRVQVWSPGSPDFIPLCELHSGTIGRKVVTSCPRMPKRGSFSVITHPGAGVLCPALHSQGG